MKSSINNILLGLVLMFYLSSVSAAKFGIDGNKLLEYCQALEHFQDKGELENPYMVGVCFGMVEGASMTLAGLSLEDLKD